MRIVRPDIVAWFAKQTRCEHCKRHCPNGCDPHHYWYFSQIGSGSKMDHPWNLVSLCRGWTNGHWASCHDDAHSGRILKVSLLAIVAAREGLIQPQIERVLRRLYLAPKGTRFRLPAGWREIFGDTDESSTRTRAGQTGR